MIKVELIGSSGFLGKHISRYLSRETSIFTTNWTKEKNGSILEKSNYEKKFSIEKPEILINTAWISNSYTNYQDEEINFEYAHNEIELIKYCNSEKIRYIGLGTIHEQYLLENNYYNSKKMLKTTDVSRIHQVRFSKNFSSFARSICGSSGCLFNQSKKATLISSVH